MSDKTIEKSSISISNKLISKLEEEAEKEFRTPELHLEFLLTKYFNGELGKTTQQDTIISTESSLAGSILGFSQEELAKFQEGQKNFKNERDLDEDIAAQTRGANIDEETYNESFSNARRRYELKQMEDNKKLRPTSESLDKIRKHSGQRKKNKT